VWKESGSWSTRTICQFEGVLGDASATAAVGKEVTVSVRPECWTLTGTRTPRNSVRGKIGESVYLGEVAQHDFVAGANQLKIYELNPAEQWKERPRRTARRW
jgi:iron(III) transport system ATP-binding protein